MGALIPLAISLVPELAKWVGLDSDIGDKAAAVVAAVTGTTDPAAAQAAVAGMDPATRATLQVDLARIAADREAAQRQAELDTFRAQLADTAGARTQTVDLAKTGSPIAWAAPIISIVIVSGFFGCVAMLFLVQRTWDERTANLLNVLFGALIPGFVQVCNYWLGSSAGSKKSGDAVRDIAASVTRSPAAATSAPAIATTGSVTVNAPPAPSPPGTTADDLNARSLAAAQGR